jgi:hypothetical protein
MTTSTPAAADTREGDIFVIGGGYSVSYVDLAGLWGIVIGVNDSGLRAPRVDRIVSMDRKWTEGRWYDTGDPALPSLCDRALPTWIRRSAIQNISERPRWLTIFDCDHTRSDFSETPERLEGTNSGLVAMNLAYQMRPRRIFLLGFDMSRGPKGEPYWYPPYPWAPAGGTSKGKYREWAHQFTPAYGCCRTAGIRVINVSVTSAIEIFQRIRPDQLERYRP